MDVDPDDLIPPDDADAVDEWLSAWEDRLAADMAARVRALLAPALQRWSGLSLVAAITDPEPFDVLEREWATLVVNEYGDVIAGLHHAGALTAWFGTPQVTETLIDQWPTVVNDLAVQYQATATNRIVGASDALWRRVRQLTVNAVSTGETTEDLKDRVEQVLGVSEQRADMIARTETTAAYNGGNYAGAQALGQYGPVEKVWSAANDARTRPSHAEADGQTVLMAAPFVVGGVTMAHPHDPSAPAREVVQCRCRALFLYPGDTRPDGTTVSVATT